LHRFPPPKRGGGGGQMRRGILYIGRKSGLLFGGGGGSGIQPSVKKVSKVGSDLGREKASRDKSLKKGKKITKFREPLPLKGSTAVG